MTFYKTPYLIENKGLLCSDEALLLISTKNSNSLKSHDNFVAFCVLGRIRQMIRPK